MVKYGEVSKSLNGKYFLEQGHLHEIYYICLVHLTHLMKISEIQDALYIWEQHTLYKNGKSDRIVQSTMIMLHVYDNCPQLASERCEQSFPDSGSKEGELKAMLEWAFGGFQPTGPEGFLPLCEGRNHSSDRTGMWDRYL